MDEKVTVDGISIRKARVFARYARGEISLNQIQDELDKVNGEGNYRSFWRKVSDTLLTILSILFDAVP